MLAEVLALAAGGAVEVTLVAVVAHATGLGCTTSPASLNDAIDKSAAADLDAAALALPLAIPVHERQVLREDVAPSPAEWVSSRDFDVVLVAGRRRLGGLRAPWRLNPTELRLV